MQNFMALQMMNRLQKYFDVQYVCFTAEPYQFQKHQGSFKILVFVITSIKGNIGLIASSLL